MTYKTNITQYFEDTVAACPDRIAVIDGDRRVSFQELYDLVVALAFALVERMPAHSSPIIAMCLSKSVEAVAADLAILYSGKAYMNLDPKSPEQRTLNILEQTDPCLVICADPAAIPAPFRDRVFVIAGPPPHGKLTDADRTALLARRDGLIDTDLLCVINTSGSTGIPKAVALNHRSFIDFTEAVCGAGLVGESEIIGSLSPTIFDIFSFELCAMLAKGAAIAVLPESMAAFPARLLQLLASLRVSFIFWVPTIMVNIANMDLLASMALPNLRMIWFAGEVFPTAKFNYWRQHLPAATFANFYGPIEITLDCLYYIADRPLPDDEPIPIGRPFRNTSILVLDENDQPAREGELCIRGSSLAMGYYNNPEKTAAAFTLNPLNHAYPETIYRTGDIVAFNRDGDLIFKGRRDTLVKHSGYRIELTEIEHVAVNALKLVPNCCVIHDEQRKKIIMVYEAPQPMDAHDLRKSLEKMLPRYMIPSGYAHVTAMPRNTNGKIDRALLREKVIAGKL